MNAKECAEFAAQHGFVVSKIDGKFHVMHTASGASAVRSRYDGIGVWMKQVQADWSEAQRQQTAAAEIAEEHDLFSARNMLRIRQLAPEVLRTAILNGTGHALDAIGAAFNYDTRRAGETDESYRYFLVTGTRWIEPISERDNVNRVLHITRKILKKERLIKVERKVTHIVRVEYKSRDAAPFFSVDAFYECSYPDAVKTARRICSGPAGKNVLRIEIKPA